MPKQKARNLDSLEDISLESLKGIKSKVSKHDLIRPFKALTYMTGEERNNIRRTLDFKWGKQTRLAEGEDIQKYLEAWEILDRNIRGVISRLHSIKQQLNPLGYSGWRKSLTGILDLTGTHFNAAATEEEVEIKFLETFGAKTKISKKSDSTLPTSGVSKLEGVAKTKKTTVTEPKIGTSTISTSTNYGKNLGIALSIVKDVVVIWDEVLGNEDEPAINSVFAICLFIHNEKVA